MSDDLVKQLREVSFEKRQEAWGRLDGGQDLSIGAMLAEEAADRIEELHNEWRMNADGWSNALIRIEELEAKLAGAIAECERIGRLWHDAEAKMAKAVEALGRLVYLQSGAPCTGIQSEQWLSEARATLAELTGDKQ